MSREIKQDLIKLQNFITGYNLAEIAGDKSFLALLSNLHRRYLAILTIQAEIDTQLANATAGVKPAPDLPTLTQSELLRESASDLGQVLFCWAHGAYKSSRVMLRSSIETFVKGMSCEDDPKVLTEKSLYRVFELASFTTFFVAPFGAVIFGELQSKYSELSSDVHTASSLNRGGISSMAYFPTFDSSAATKAANLAVYVMTRMISALSLHYNKCFHEMHHRNKEIVLSSVLSVHKRRIQNIE